MNGSQPARWLWRGCTGAFVLAAAGLLDGYRATTHWEDAAAPARRYPAIDVDPNVLYVDNGGRLLTSAGLAASLDMCLHMVGSDYGASVAAATARRVVVPLVRAGGQAQFSAPKSCWRLPTCRSSTSLTMSGSAPASRSGSSSPGASGCLRSGTGPRSAPLNRSTPLPDSYAGAAADAILDR